MTFFIDNITKIGTISNSNYENSLRLHEQNISVLNFEQNYSERNNETTTTTTVESDVAFLVARFVSLRLGGIARLLLHWYQCFFIHQND